MSTSRTNRFSEPLAVASLMSRFDKPWYVAGGWAIDLFLGATTRPHKDCEIAIFRDDQLALRDYLAGWLFTRVEKGRVLPWHDGLRLELPTHEAYASLAGYPQQKVEILLNERDDAHWVFRKNPLVTRQVSLSGLHTGEGIPYLAPEIVLLYKALSVTRRPEDEADFAATLPRLDMERREWLAAAICTRHPHHPWLPLL